ncbi:MAG: hypothetical protein KI791_09550 [Cyclobacteriaceae bacterium]|nr:hypothetical protein [Cyclobacteriaceae bacterium SS2]
MDITKKTKEELASKIKDLEDFIAKKGIGSNYLARAEKVQRNINIALFLGISVTIVGLSIWLFSGKNTEED